MIPEGKMAESPARHPDIDTPGQLSEKIAWLREITGGKPISLKFVGGHIQEDLNAVFNQEHIPDVLVIDGGEGTSGVTRITRNVGEVLAQLPAVIESLTGTDLKKILGKAIEKSEKKQKTEKEIIKAPHESSE